ncbi:putative high pI alpha-glucosidase [Blattamonas nauphoetae]|uniref:High pI alpha-glucosidase n=1 Tax=Blattamonas nauphoetae TaxID=2049346 RepID=A0ABQ9YDV7_9EUKA|nr:putative high pI alpha-glucosidase [Blattamonas nauphoetae]
METREIKACATEAAVILDRGFQFRNEECSEDQSHVDGTPIILPLSFVFPTDTHTYGIDKQTMLGTILLSTPVLTEGATSVSGYFPLERWYSFHTDEEDVAVSMKGREVTVPAQISTCPVHFKGGSIVTRQRTRALSIQKMKDSPIYVTAFLSKDNIAEGFLHKEPDERASGVRIKPETARDTFNDNAKIGTLQIGSRSRSSVVEQCLFEMFTQTSAHQQVE